VPLRIDDFIHFDSTTVQQGVIAMSNVTTAPTTASTKGRKKLVIAADRIKEVHTTEAAGGFYAESDGMRPPNAGAFYAESDEMRPPNAG
jgi:hypothetical protein